MKISLALAPRRTVSRETAWGCLTANLALPGAGSLAAGRRVGYAQMILAMVSLGLTLIFGIRFAAWLFAHWKETQQIDADPVMVMADMWQRLRWALLALGLFIASVLWALGTSIHVLREATQAENANKPPIVP